MNCEWASLAARKMTLSGLLLLLVFIRHVSASYQEDYPSKWPNAVRSQHHQTTHQHSRSALQAYPSPHHHRHHHENLPKSNRDVHIKSQHLRFLSERDYREVTAVTKEITTTTPRPIPRTTYSMAWKWGSTTAANLGLPVLTHIRRQGDNESSGGSAVLSGERQQQWSSNYRQLYSGPYRMHTSGAAGTNPAIVPTHSDRINRSPWLHYNHPIQQYDARHLQDEDNHPALLEKSSRLLSLDNIKINQRQEAEDNFNIDDYMDDDPTVQNDNANEKTESLTEEKWKELGTAVAVEKSRRRYNNEGQSAATAHIQRIKEESKCRWPHPKVIPVTEASKRFVPHCTILHRCGDDTGCCDYDTKTCTAKTISRVHLYFYVIPLGGSASVELRSFDNHTECHCVDRCLLGSGCVERGSGNLGNYVAPGNGTCQCPSYFDIITEEFPSGRCRCDCINSNRDCQLLKRGRDSFPADDQRCIADEKCQKPTCQYGNYSINSGRCPMHRHQKRTISRYDYR